MPKRIVSRTRSRAATAFSYDQLEARRKALLSRLTALGASVRSHPGYENALTLLNQRFRRSRLIQRAAVLESAAWLIDVLEKIALLS